MNLKFICAYFFYLTYSGVLSGQNQFRIDSLLNIIETQESSIEEEVEANLKLAAELYKHNRDTSFHYAFIGLALAKESESDYLIAKAYTQTSLKNVNDGKYLDALSDLNTSIDLLENLPINSISKKELYNSKILTLRNRGTVHNYLNDHEAAITDHLQASDLAEQIGSDRELSLAYYNLAVVHFSNQNFERASQFQQKGYQIVVKLDDILLRLLLWRKNITYYNHLWKLQMFLIPFIIKAKDMTLQSTTR